MLVYGTFQKYSAWSISTTDGLSVGVPYIFSDKLCYPEMVGKDYPLYTMIEMILQKFNNMLDNEINVRYYNSYLNLKIVWNELYI